MRSFFWNTYLLSSFEDTMINIERNLYKTEGKKLLNYLLNVMRENTQVSQKISQRNEKCLEIMDDIVLKLNKIIYFNQDAPDDAIVENLGCCLIKLYEIGAIIRENDDELNRMNDDLETNIFLINCNVEEDSYEL